MNTTLFLLSQGLANAAKNVINSNLANLSINIIEMNTILNQYENAIKDIKQDNEG